MRNYPFLAAAHANRLAHAYGTARDKIARQREIDWPISASRSAPP